MRRAQQQTITFPAYDSTVTTGVTKTGLALLAADVKISKDGATPASATNAPTEIGTTGRYSLVLTAAETNCAYLHLWIEKTGMRPYDLYGAMESAGTASVVADGSNTASAFVTNLTSAITDAHKNKLIRFQTGTLVGQVRKVAGYNGTTKALSFATAFSAAPAASDVFTLIDS